MLLSAWVLTLGCDEAAAARVEAALGAWPGVTLGERCGARLPLAIESASQEAQASFYEAARSLPGVVTAEVVLVDFSEHEVAEGVPVGLESPRMRRAG
jgi:nitrate reductase NapAB chaperone NapD